MKMGTLRAHSVEGRDSKSVANDADRAVQGWIGAGNANAGSAGRYTDECLNGCADGKGKKQQECGTHEQYSSVGIGLADHDAGMAGWAGWHVAAGARRRSRHRCGQGQ